jgi:hypothetical protein
VAARLNPVAGIVPQIAVASWPKHNAPGAILDVAAALTPCFLASSAIAQYNNDHDNLSDRDMESGKRIFAKDRGATGGRADGKTAADAPANAGAIGKLNGMIAQAISRIKRQ